MQLASCQSNKLTTDTMTCQQQNDFHFFLWPEKGGLKNALQQKIAIRMNVNIVLLDKLTFLSEWALFVEWLILLGFGDYTFFLQSPMRWKGKPKGIQRGQSFQQASPGGAKSAGKKETSVKRHDRCHYGDSSSSHSPYVLALHQQIPHRWTMKMLAIAQVHGLYCCCWFLVWKVEKTRSPSQSRIRSRRAPPHTASPVAAVKTKNVSRPLFNAIEGDWNLEFGIHSPGSGPWQRDAYKLYCPVAIYSVQWKSSVLQFIALFYSFCQTMWCWPLAAGIAFKSMKCA